MQFIHLTCSHFTSLIPCVLRSCHCCVTNLRCQHLQIVPGHCLHVLMVPTCHTAVTWTWSKHVCMNLVLWLSVWMMCDRHVHCQRLLTGTNWSDNIDPIKSHLMILMSLYLISLFSLNVSLQARVVLLVSMPPDFTFKQHARVFDQSRIWSQRMSTQTQVLTSILLLATVLTSSLRRCPY